MTKMAIFRFSKIKANQNFQMLLFTILHKSVSYLKRPELQTTKDVCIIVVYGVKAKVTGGLAEDAKKVDLPMTKI